MVTIDINIQGLISLYEDSSIKKEEIIKKLNEFSKEELIQHIISDVETEDDDEVKDDGDERKDLVW